ncbi:hypothetical protein [Candidatus Solirubrobacter pratensis]|uniref:hypothetical protein n=1 Tax=Candidatus Solirubrobacter pratensis TaxID=1298857 RepID=UPI000408E959|nr:hypothetical protein [Candidatus Solirubrobacter pratensis]
MPKAISLLATAVLAALLAGGCGTAAARHDTISASTRGARSGPPPLPPARDFVRIIDNPWFPLKPGTVLISEGEGEGIPARDVLRVTHRTKHIQGIRATVIDDRVYTRGHLAEHTHDYYAQDRHGNVWYLGEDTATLNPNGQVDSREGTWLTGRHGAKAGIFMPAHPKPGDAGWQEYYPGHAQDRYRILNQHTEVHTPAASSRQAMLIREITPLEPGVVDHKIYMRGIGTVREETVKGGNERYQLVSIRPH